MTGRPNSTLRSWSRGFASAGLLAVLSSTGGCSDAAARATTTGDTMLPDTLVISGDAELRDRVAELLPSLAERAGLPLVRPVRVEWRSRAELETYLLAQLDTELPIDEADYITRSYSQLGLVPETLDLRTLLVEVYKEQVAGFYDPDSLALWIMDDQEEAMVQTILLHELVHAVQDQAVSLDALTDNDLGSDRRAAAQAAIEGHATLVMLEEMMERQTGQSVDVTELPQVAASLSPSEAQIQGQFPALAEAPRIVQASLLFPYVAGAGFVLELWKDEPGRPAPFGAALPTSTEHVLQPSTFLDEPRQTPLELEVVSGTDELYSDQIGELGLRIFSEDVLGAAPDQPTGWAGDRFALFESDQGDGVVWAIVFDSLAERDAFASLAGPWAEQAGNRLLPSEVEGRPGVVVLLGASPEATVRAAG